MKQALVIFTETCSTTRVKTEIKRETNNCKRRKYPSPIYSYCEGDISDTLSMKVTSFTVFVLTELVVLVQFPVLLTGSENSHLLVTLNNLQSS